MTHPVPPYRQVQKAYRRRRQTVQVGEVLQTQIEQIRCTASMPMIRHPDDVSHCCCNVLGLRKLLRTQGQLALVIILHERVR